MDGPDDAISSGGMLLVFSIITGLLWYDTPEVSSGELLLQSMMFPCIPRFASDCYSKINCIFLHLGNTYLLLLLFVREILCFTYSMSHIMHTLLSDSVLIEVVGDASLLWIVEESSADSKTLLLMDPSPQSSS